MIKNNKDPQKGQSLVELAIALPLLLLMLLGVFEVGWALRGYLTLVNANREATRFAARGVYLDFDEKSDANLVGYEKILTHTNDSLANQLTYVNFFGIDPTANSSIIITYYSVEPGSFVCPNDANCTNFVCDKFLDPAYDGTTDEPGFDISALNDIEYPFLIAPVGYNEPDDYNSVPSFYTTKIASDTVGGLIDHYEAITTYHYHSGGPYFSRIDPAEQVADLQRKSNKLNCELQKKSLQTSDTKMVVVENIVNQDQLVGLPFVSAFVPNPIPLYAHTAMRINPAAREQVDDEDEEGCSLYPLMIPNSRISGLNYGKPITIPIDTGGDHNVPGHLGFTLWDSSQAGGGSEAAKVEEYLDNPASAGDQFSEPIVNPADTNLDATNLDWISASGVRPDEGNVETKLLGLDDTDMVFPVWNDADCLVSGSGTCVNAIDTGAAARYRAFTFVQLRLTAVEFGASAACDNPGQKCAKFLFLGFDSTACEGDNQ